MYFVLGVSLIHVARNARESTSNVMLGRLSNLTMEKYNNFAFCSVDLLLFAVEANELTTIMLITNSIQYIYGISQLRLRGHKVILVSNTWPEVFDGRECIEGLRWKEDVHSNESHVDQARRPSPEPMISIIDEDFPNLRDDVILLPNSFPVPFGNVLNPSRTIPPPSPGKLKRKRNSSTSSTIPGAYPGSDLFSDDETDFLSMGSVTEDVLFPTTLHHQRSESVEDADLVSATACSSVGESDTSYQPPKDSTNDTPIPATPDVFRILIEILTKERNNGQLSTAHSRLDCLLREASPDIYRLAGVSGIREYLELARAKHGIVLPMTADNDQNAEDMSVFLRQENATRYLADASAAASQNMPRSNPASLGTVLPFSQHDDDTFVKFSSPPVPSITYAISTEDAKESITPPSSQASEFNPLISALRKLHREGTHSIELQQLFQPLIREDPLVFDRAGIFGQQRLTKYIERARELGIVTINILVSGISKLKYVRLAKAYIMEEEVVIVLESKHTSPPSSGVNDHEASVVKNSDANYMAFNREASDSSKNVKVLSLPAVSVPPPLPPGPGPTVQMISFRGQDAHSVDSDSVKLVLGLDLGVVEDAAKVVETSGKAGTVEGVNGSFTAVAAESPLVPAKPSPLRPLATDPEPSKSTLAPAPTGKKSGSAKPEPTKPSPAVSQSPKPPETKTTKPNSLAKEKSVPNSEPSKSIPVKFKALVTVLRELRKQNYEIKRCRLSQRLLQQDKHVFDYLNDRSRSVTKITRHTNEASQAGIIKLSGDEEVTVKLHPDYW